MPADAAERPSSLPARTALVRVGSAVLRVGQWAPTL